MPLPNWKHSVTAAVAIVSTGMLVSTSETVQTYLSNIQHQLDEDLAEEAMQNPNALRNPLIHVEALEPCRKMNEERVERGLERVTCG